MPALEILEGKCGRLTDYGLTYIKFIAQACEDQSVNRIISLIECWFDKNKWYQNLNPV